MVVIIGNVGCSLCKIAKNKMEEKNEEFIYKNIGECAEEEQKMYITQARQSGLLHFPLIFKDGKQIALAEILGGN